MAIKPSNLDGLNLDALLAEGLRESGLYVPSAWEPPTPEQLGLVLPRHRVIRLIGRGGMGAVYEARQIDLDRRVAVKVLPVELGKNEAFAERFRREARALARLRHPNILEVFEFGQSTAGHLFFSMEYMEGGDLARRMKQGPLNPGLSLRWVKEICAALEAAHALSVVHRDIKPSNILLTSDGTVKVADFGLAVLADQPEERLTHTGLALGTLEYSAPEQAAGTAVDYRTDLFSVGVLCYELLTGRLPRGVFEPPSRVNAAVGTAVDTVVLTAMQSDPARRFQSATEFGAALRGVEASPVPTAPAVPAVRHARVSRRAALGAGVGGVALVATAVATYGWRRRHQVSRRTTSPFPSEGPRVVVWGLNRFGQGNVPRGLAGVRGVRAGFRHNLALLSDGTVVAWGQNSEGQNHVPAGLSGVRAVAAGGTHSVALKADGTLVGWGRNAEGQIDIPADLPAVQAVAAGSHHTVALLAGGTVVCWGDNQHGQLQLPPGLKDVRAIEAGNSHTLALLSDGTVVGWGENFHGQCAVPAGLGDVQAIAAGGFHNVALKRDGTLAVWGNNDAAQTVVPRGLADVQLIAAGYRHTLALKRDGQVVAWGWNDDAQTEVPHGLTGVLGLAAGPYHSVAWVR